MTLADALERAIAEHGAAPAASLARELRRRYADVLAALDGDPRFEHVGRRKGSRWSLAPSRNGRHPAVVSFTTADAAERWRCSEATASEFLFGEEGFEARGLVERLDGNGRVRVTARGLELALGLEDAAGAWLGGAG